jgi:uncharacterized SAM-binding protein YcdF (DUF218 family)
MIKRIGRIFLWSLMLFLAALLALYIFREAIFQRLGNYLIFSQPPKKAEAIFVLAGHPIERGRKAAELYQGGFAPKVICTGGAQDSILLLFGVKATESAITRQQLLKLGVSSSAITLVPRGTSTYEECDAILDYCRTKGLKRILVVSSLFHTRRVGRTLSRLVRERDSTRWQIVGAPAIQYQESQWWKSEHGLIFVNNEYVKLLYYTLKY